MHGLPVECMEFWWIAWNSYGMHGIPMEFLWIGMHGCPAECMESAWATQLLRATELYKIAAGY